MLTEQEKAQIRTKIRKEQYCITLDQMKQYFKDHPDIADDVQKQIMEKVAEERSKLAQSHAARPSAAVPTEKAEKPADKAPRPSSSKAVSIDADDFDDLDEE